MHDSDGAEQREPAAGTVPGPSEIAGGSGVARHAPVAPGVPARADAEGDGSLAADRVPAGAGAGGDGSVPPAGEPQPARRAEDVDQVVAVLQAQRSWLEIFEQAPSLIAVTRGADHRFELANPLFVRSVGSRELLGRPAREVFAEGEAAEFLRRLDSVYVGGETQRVDELYLRLDRHPGGGEDGCFNFVFQPLRSGDGTAQGLLIHGVDVTQQVRARHEAQDQAAELELQAEELQTQAGELELQAEELQTQASELEVLHEEANATAARLARSEALLAEAQRMAGVGSWEWDVRTGDIIWSDELYRLFGEEPGSLTVSLQAYLDRIHPEDRARVAETVQQALHTRQPFGFEHRIVRADGSTRDFHCRGRVWTDRDGAPIRLSGSAQDVTELLAAEHARREDARVVATLHQFGRSISAGLDTGRIVQEATDAATALTGAEFGAFFYNVVNAAGESYTLYTLSGAPREAFSQFPMPRNTPVFGPTFRGEGVVRSDDITADPRYGRMEPYRGMPPGHLPVRSYLAVPVISRTGDVLGGLFFGHPEPGCFAERHERLAVGIAGWAAVALDNARLFDAERRARADAERANSAKSDFLATMSHELRTPLNAMIGYSDLLLAGVPDPIPESARSKVERIGLSARHLLELIEEILTFSRLEAGEESVHLEEGEAGSVAAEVQALLEPLALARQLTFACELPATPVSIRTDLRKLRQILLNLVGNAIKFTDTGGVSLALAAEDDDVVFHVRDTGRGIAAEHAEKIFEPFWQVEQGATRSKEGTGLGLSVVRRLVALLGGELQLESQPGAGSRFSVRLPRQR